MPSWTATGYDVISKTPRTVRRALESFCLSRGSAMVHPPHNFLIIVARRLGRRRRLRRRRRRFIYQYIVPYSARIFYTNDRAEQSRFGIALAPAHRSHRNRASKRSERMKRLVFGELLLLLLTFTYTHIKVRTYHHIYGM